MSIERALDSLCMEVTTRCPLRCVHCSACASPETTHRIDLVRFRTYLESLPRLRELYLSGGEPFEHPELEALVEAAGTNADQVVIYSSGTCLTHSGLSPLPEDVLARLVPREGAPGVQRIDLSIYSASTEHHELVTGTPGSFAVTLTSARQIRAAGIEIGVHYVPLPGVDHCLPDVVRLAHELGATRLHVLAPVRQGRALRLAETALSPRLLNDLRSLCLDELHLKLVLSSAVRRSLGQSRPTQRDRWQSGFIDVRGHFYPGEGFRGPDRRSSLSVLACRADMPLSERVAQNQE